MGPLFLLLTIVPFLEIYFLLTLGKSIGAGNTFTIIIVTGLIGAYVLKLQGARVMQEAQQKMQSNQIPAEALTKGLFTLLGGVLLLTPGFLTDALGFSLVLPPTQKLWRIFFGNKVKQGVASGKIHVYTPGGGRNPGQQAPGPKFDPFAQTRTNQPADDSNVIDITAKSKRKEPLD